jgi:hypothetical protein
MIWDQNTNPPAKMACPQEGPRFNDNTGSPLVSLVESPAVTSLNIIVKNNHIF